MAAALVAADAVGLPVILMMSLPPRARTGGSWTGAANTQVATIQLSSQNYLLGKSYCIDPVAAVMLMAAQQGSLRRPMLSLASQGNVAGDKIQAIVDFLKRPMSQDRQNSIEDSHSSMNHASMFFKFAIPRRVI